MMDTSKDPFIHYTELLTASFDKINRALPKKYKEIKEILTKLTEQLKADTALNYNANKYFVLYKLCIETKNTKLIELSLYYIQKLIAYGYMDGNCKDDTFYIHIEEYVGQDKDKIPDKKRKLIDAIVESVCQTNYEKEESIQLQVMKVLLTILTSLKAEIHDRSLLHAFRTFYQINITSKNSVNQTTARAALNQLVNLVFQRMEEYNFGNEEWRKAQAQKKLEKNGAGMSGLSPRLKSEIQKDQSQFMGSQDDSSVQIETGTTPVDGSALLKTGRSTAPPRLFDSFSPLNRESYGFGETSVAKCKLTDLGVRIDSYITSTVQHLVDDVVLYDAKVKIVKKLAETDPNKDKERLAEELSSIPLRSVPLALSPDDPKYRRVIETQAENEKGQKAGLFGWCFVCRNPADLYCKDSRVPICSIDCKTKHLDEIDDIYSFQTGTPSETRRVNVYLNDAVQLFKLICKMSTRDENPQYGLKSKILVLELLRGLLEAPGPTFLARNEFAYVIKDYLCESLLKNSVSADRPVVTLSLGIFVCLVNHFRHHLKQEIAVFIDGVFLKMLESGNSTYYHRLLALQVIYKMSQRAINMIEFYVNYDCDAQYTTIVERIMEFLSKISQGKYSKTEYNNVIQPVQEYNLKTLALESMVSFCKSLVRFADEVDNRSRASKTTFINEALAQNQTLIADMNDGNQEDSELAGDEGKDDLNEQLVKTRKMKVEIQRTILKFNIKPKVGLKYIFTLGYLKEDAKEVGHFLMKYHKNISKETLGDYFGDESHFNIAVLEAFTDLISFKKMSIDEAMKHFLTYFDLPGEAQKVDRIVQVFARKYIHDNPNTVYKSSTAAYTLSYLLMMLQTSIHNPQVTEKMTLAQFVDLARGLNDGENIPVDTLNGIYARVLKAPLAIPSSQRAKQNLLESTQASVKKKQDLFIRESQNMIQKGKEQIKKGQLSTFIRVQTAECIQPLFGIMWSPLLASFSVLLEQNDDPKIIQLCLEGYVLSINLSGRYGLETERDTFVTSLYNFTGLKKGYSSTFKEIKEKHLRAIKSILQVGSNQGNNLRSSWGQIIECMSRIDHFLNLNTTLKRDSSNPLKRESSKEADAAANSEAAIGDLIRATIDPNLLDLVFSKSSLFNADEIIAFISCLCRVSQEELKEATPRTYCLQKIVEVAEYNMNRVKFVWQKIWNIMQEHFSKVGCHHVLSISMFAVDSLKQLALKFLKIEELASFDFQKEFLKPFETIFINYTGESTEIKELILTCINHIISHSFKKIKSGWKIIFDVLGYSADSDKPVLVETAFNIVQKHFSNDLSPIRDNLLDYMHVLLKFMQCRVEKISFSAVTLIQQCISSLVQAHDNKKEPAISLVNLNSESPTSSPLTKPKSIPEDLDAYLDEPEEGEITTYYGLTEESWLTLLGKLATMASDPRSKIASTSLQTLYTVLKENGGVFTHDFWQMIMSSVIKLLFDEIQFSFQSRKYGSKDQSFEFFKQNCKLAYTRVIDLFKTHYFKLKAFTPEFFNILVISMQNPNEFLPKISIDAFKNFLNTVSHFYNEKDWDIAIETIEKIYATTAPNQLLEAKDSEIFQSANETKTLVSITFNYDEAVTKCVVQLLLIGVIRDLLEEHFTKFTKEHIDRLAQILQSSYNFARTYNEFIFLRYCLWKNGFMKDMAQLPGLLKQEKEALAIQTLLLCKKYHSAVDETAKKEFLNQFLDNCMNVMKLYSTKFDEYVALSKEEAALKKKPRDGKATEEAKEGDGEESLEATLKKLKFIELEREIVNLRSIVALVVPKLNELDLLTIKPRMKEIARHLININGNSLAKTSLYIKEEAIQEKIEPVPEDIDLMIKEILIKYFEFALPE